jgi:hypothetical protein
LGENCHYFVDNGEPGYCASLSEIWQAKISPWEEILSDGNKYTKVSDLGMYIEGTAKKEVAAWTPLTFGVITDKQATCKIDTNFSKTFDSMTTTMLSEKDFETGKIDGTHHQITLSPHVSYANYQEELETATKTLPIESGDNEYYIKCKNFAGQENEAAFVVKIRMSDGPDLTAPIITRYVPKDNSYIKVGKNSSDLDVYLNEPAECKYSIGTDYNTFEEMPLNMSCQTDVSAGFYGEWPCFARLENLTSSSNQIYIKCKDQPDLQETDLITRNPSPRSLIYDINRCEVGLSINVLSPAEGSIIEGKNLQPVELSVKTSGCINNGEATCSYSVPRFGENYADFLQTGGTTHKQTFTNLPEGSNLININCIDEAGNQANKSVSFNLFIDNDAPTVTRIFKIGPNLVLKTNELAECVFKLNRNAQNCDFGFEDARNTSSTIHTLSNALPGVYEIKCRDSKLNEPSGCSAIINFK